MKKIALLIFLVSLGAANLHADDQMSAVQQELKDQGFYYGEVDGQPGPETAAAIRRYQIRNGLHVDGTLNKQTLASLKVPGAPAAATTAKNAPLPPRPAPLDTQDQQAQTQPAQSPQQDVTQSDREFLRKQNGAAATPTPPPAQTDNTNVVSAPVVVQQQVQPQPPQLPQAPPLAVQFVALFARTPYQNAPLEVQQDTLRTAQAVLARQTYYNGEIDGIPGPATAHAIISFQNDAGLAQTARLDLQTLSALHLLPNQGPARRVIIQPFFPPPRIYVQPRVYRGNWYD